MSLAPNYKELEAMKKLSEAKYQTAEYKPKTTFGHVMLDLETLDTEPGGLILSVAAVPFDLKSGEEGEPFYAKINVNSSLDLGFTVSAETTKWWLRQDPKVFAEALSGDVSALSTLNLLSEWMSRRTSENGEELHVWGNSNRFDMGLLSAYYKKCGIKLPWNNFKELDVRTLVFFAPEIKVEAVAKAKENSIQLHHPVADCQMQIEYCSKIYNKLGKV